MLSRVTALNRSLTVLTLQTGWVIVTGLPTRKLHLVRETFYSPKGALLKVIQVVPVEKVIVDSTEQLADLKKASH